jgi:hypothetical protein
MAGDVNSNKFSLSLGLAIMLSVAVFFLYGHSTMASAETQLLTGIILNQHNLIKHPKQVEKKTLDDSLLKLIQRERELENSIDDWMRKTNKTGDSPEKQLQKNKDLEELLDKVTQEYKELKDSLAEGRKSL